ncbi:phosphate ABC transporter permease PstA [Conexibacter sp. S30A1]|uniref:phosphate ABC transporter permease PstA n=1 Tax=Conexibacter sp. S30A1 TaxID=2937800 RepID=UPI00200E25E3|nr:phosphate ABC transporter permease PstA [Conexibacter sp. S30A1]
MSTATGSSTTLLGAEDRNLRRRRLTDRLMRLSATAAAGLAVAVLAIVVGSVLIKGASALSIPFLTQNPAVGLGAVGGGIANAIVGSALIVAVGTAMALPLGILIALYLTEFATPRTAPPIRLVLDLLNGTPTIVIGVFIFGLLVVSHSQTGFAASIALAIIMLPLMARTTQEMLLLVPGDLRNAAHALGVRRWRMILGIVLPSALGGILTGAILAIARAFGETAPLLLCDSVFGNTTTLNIFGTAIPNIPIDIYRYSESGFPSDHARAWGAALVLIALILVGNLSARAMLARQRRKLAGR